MPTNIVIYQLNLSIKTYRIISSYFRPYFMPLFFICVIFLYVLTEGNGDVKIAKVDLFPAKNRVARWFL